MSELALADVLSDVDDSPVVVVVDRIGGWVEDLLREIRADLKQARAREKKLLGDLALLKKNHVPWSDAQEQLPLHERISQMNVLLASESAMARHDLWLVAVRRLIEELEEELADAKAAPAHP